jgi:glucose-6-phosphate isomerase
MWAKSASIFLDFSRQRVASKALGLLVRRADESELRNRIHAKFLDEPIKTTEGRAVVHVGLRMPRGELIMDECKDVVPDVHLVLDCMSNFEGTIRNGTSKGHTGKRVRYLSTSASAALVWVP